MTTELKKSYLKDISIQEAIDMVKSQAIQLETEKLSLSAAYGRNLAQDLKSLVDHPSCNNSALDGYACRLEDSLNATQEHPVSLNIIGDVPAGSVFAGVVGLREAVSIYTGAPVPAGADAIIAVEDTFKEGDRVFFKRPARSDDIRPRGQDIKAGEIYLRKGQKLTPAAIGVAASMGYAELEVFKAPRIGILATGDEVIEPGLPIRDGQVYNSNSYSVAGLVHKAGGIPILLPRAIDDPKILRETIERAGGLDFLITSGGVSMGKYDFVRDLLFHEGKVHFWKVAIRPGGPTLFGEWQGMKVFGLPGNPVSSMVVFLLIAEVWLRASLGGLEPPLYHQRLKARALSEFKGAGYKEAFRRAKLNFNHQDHCFEVTTTGDQSSGILTSMLYGEALAITAPYQNAAVGDWLDIIPL
ncbi:MAG: molybdopterin molybdotransferase MoeA [Deinococcales bacterium]